MITRENIVPVLEKLGFVKNIANIWGKSFGNIRLGVDTVGERFIYPDDLKINVKTTVDFSAPENFVVFECVHRLLEKGYKPQHIELEHPVRVGHGSSGGRLDIWVKDNNGRSLLIIECKTPGREFDNAWTDTLEDGGQLFSYAHALDSKTQYVALYSSGWNGTAVVPRYRLISMRDNEEFLGSLPKDAPSFTKAATVKERFRAWNETYQQDSSTRGLFEDDIAAYRIGKTSYSVNDLKTVDADEIRRKYHQFATILRQHNVSGHENAFDKLVNLFLAKIVDEIENPGQLKFYWKGAAYDDIFSLTDRLQYLYTRGMEEFLGEQVTYIEQRQIEDAFRLFKKDATKRVILDYFRQLKFFTNNDFAFVDVHNERLFHQNAKVLLKMVLMLQDISLTRQEQNQFLGDLFEGFLDRGIKQSEGQFFTPIPIVRFLVSSLPLARLVDESPKPPRVIDYACGSGHFLNEYCNQIFPFVRARKSAEQPDEVSPKIISPDHFRPYYAAVTGVEKEYRLSKVSKVSASMYGQGDIRIIYSDALAAHSDVEDGSYSVLVANPPYSVRGFLETLSEEDRERYELFDASLEVSRGNYIECFFVERAKQLLAPGGVAAIILPASVLSNTGIYTRMRELILKYFDLVAIVELGSGTFGKTGTNTATLFLRRKKSKPEVAEHYQNRVEAWFEGDFSKDATFADAHLREAYCNHVGISPVDYGSLLQGTPGESLLKQEIFKAYRSSFDSSAESKRIQRKRLTAKYTAESRQAELEQAWLNYLRTVESEKLYYYLLATDNPQSVVLVKSPAGTRAMKEFLGYEWSARKGDEGIKYLGTAASTDDDPLARSHGVSNINTPLFNPANLAASDKINSIIRSAFNREKIDIPEALDSFVSQAPLADLIDFATVSFEKAFRTNVTQSEFSITSKHPLQSISEVADIISGGTPSTNNPSYWDGDIPWLSVADFSTVQRFVHTAEKTITQAGLENSSTRILQEGDIIISARGTVGAMAQLAIPMAFNQSCYGLRTKGEISNAYIFYVLKHYIQQLQSKASGTKFDAIIRKTFDQVKIPVPKDEDIRNQIVSECEAIDAECEKAEKTVFNSDQEIESLFSGGHQQANTPFKLSSHSDFDLSIGQRVLNTELEPDGAVPVYSANVFEPFGYFSKLLIEDFSAPSVLWGIDGDWMVNYLPENQPFYPTDHCGVLRVKTDLVNPRYLSDALHREGIRQRFSRTLRASTARVKALTLLLPPRAEQDRIVGEVEKLEATIATARATIAAAPERKAEILKKYLE